MTSGFGNIVRKYLDGGSERLSNGWNIVKKFGLRTRCELYFWEVVGCNCDVECVFDCDFDCDIECFFDCNFDRDCNVECVCVCDCDVECDFDCVRDRVNWPRIESKSCSGSFRFNNIVLI